MSREDFAEIFGLLRTGVPLAKGKEIKKNILDVFVSMFNPKTIDFWQKKHRFLTLRTDITGVPFQRTEVRVPPFESSIPGEQLFFKLFPPETFVNSF